MFLASAIQLRTGRNVHKNIEDAVELIHQAADAGADLICTPETTHLMELSSKSLFANVRMQDDEPALETFCELAAKLDIWLNIGSLAIRLSDTKVANRQFLISPEGQIAKTYDKLHMFDVELDNGETYRESKNYMPGDKAVIVPTILGNIGLSICYDLRFPALYRSLAKAGADVMTVPSAFTEATGKEHWHVLLRARAIENGCFVIAAAQGGEHENGRRTYGHSLIVSPRGEILAEADKDPGFIIAPIDIDDVQKARKAIPSLTADRFFNISGIDGSDGLKAVS